MAFRWEKSVLEDEKQVAALAASLNNAPEALARALVLRGIHTLESARSFFRADLSSLHDPFHLMDMEPAVTRVIEAIHQKERVLVYGDYDVDGTTAAAVMTSFLRSMGVDAFYFIPDRYKDGYGLSQTGIDLADAQGAGLVIALDCGITAHEEARYARSKHIDLIICDHHKAGEKAPEALAVLDPKREDCAYPFEELSGCGVGFKLIQAVLEQLKRDPEEGFAYLDLLAISIASDIVPLLDENRILMRAGLQRLQNQPRLGIRMLAEESELDLTACTVRDIVFGLGPRINAAGRIGDAQRAVALMLSQDEHTARGLAHALQQDNLTRRKMDQDIQAQAIRMAERQNARDNQHCFVLMDANWHLGVIGIVASRIVERFYRPTILLSENEGVLKGSARSIHGINIYHALKECEDLLITFGGHDYAAGMSLLPSQFDAFADRFNHAIGKQVSHELLKPVIHVDAPLSLDAIDERFWAILKQFEPLGPENNNPVFHGSGLEVVGNPRRIGQGGKHLKFRVKQANTAPSFDAIAFGSGDKIELLRQSMRQGIPFEMLFSVEENTWQGRTSLQLKTRDLRLPG